MIRPSQGGAKGLRKVLQGARYWNLLETTNRIYEHCHFLE